MVDIALAPLSLSPGTFQVGETVRVTVSFRYTAGADTTVKLAAGPYYRNLIPPFKHLVDACVGSASVSLPAALTPQAMSANVDFILFPKYQGGIEDGTYGLRAWIEGIESVAEQDGVITVFGNLAAGDTGITGAQGLLRNIGVVAFTGINLTIGDGDTVLLAPSLLLGRKRQAPPLIGLSVGDALQIMCSAYNQGASPVQFSLHWKMTKPNGKVIEDDDSPASPTAAGKSVDFTDPTGNRAIVLDQPGDWKLNLTLKALPGGNVVDTYEATVVQGVASGAFNLVGDLLTLGVMFGLVWLMRQISPTEGR